MSKDQASSTKSGDKVGECHRLFFFNFRPSLFFFYCFLFVTLTAQRGRKESTAKVQGIRGAGRFYTLHDDDPTLIRLPTVLFITKR